MIFLGLVRVGYHLVRVAGVTPNPPIFVKNSYSWLSIYLEQGWEVVDKSVGRDHSFGDDRVPFLRDYLESPFEPISCTTVGKLAVRQIHEQLVYSFVTIEVKALSLQLTWGVSVL
jgi:hypothetical protein